MLSFVWFLVTNNPAPHAACFLFLLSLTTLCVLFTALSNSFVSSCLFVSYEECLSNRNVCIILCYFGKKVLLK